jgi:hypothetical protein
MLKTSKPAAVFSISIPGDIGGYGARYQPGTMPGPGNRPEIRVKHD